MSSWPRPSWRVGRPELGRAGPEDELTEEAVEASRWRARSRPARGGEAAAIRWRRVAAGSRAVASRRAGAGSRLVNFLQGSWRELQRVQWPDRRQVMQATGVVIGFVIVAGVFLGVADLVANKVVQLILK